MLKEQNNCMELRNGCELEKNNWLPYQYTLLTVTVSSSSASLVHKDANHLLAIAALSFTHHIPLDFGGWRAKLVFVNIAALHEQFSEATRTTTGFGACWHA
jgi:hypothetical protein